MTHFKTVNIEKVPFSRDLRSKTEINIRFFPSSSAAFSCASFRSVRDRAYVGEDRDHGGRNDDERRKNANDRRECARVLPMVFVTGRSNSAGH